MARSKEAESLRRPLVNFAAHWLRLEPTFGSRNPETITFLDVQAWISEQEGTLTPAALRNYLGTLRQILGYAGVNPNPARDERLSLPERDEPEVTPPEAEHVLAFLERVKTCSWTWGDVDLESSLLFAFMERCGTRVTCPNSS